MSNEFFATESGVLYNSDFTQLIAVCGGINNVEVNSNTKSIGPKAFQR